MTQRLIPDGLQQRMSCISSTLTVRDNYGYNNYRQDAADATRFA